MKLITTLTKTHGTKIHLPQHIGQLGIKLRRSKVKQRKYKIWIIYKKNEKNYIMIFVKLFWNKVRLFNIMHNNNI
jgi:hypothetical protein